MDNQEKERMDALDDQEAKDGAPADEAAPDAGDQAEDSPPAEDTPTENAAEAEAKDPPVDEPVESSKTEEEAEENPSLPPAVAERLKAAEAQVAALKLGVPPERVGYITRLADTADLDPDAEDFAAKVAAAVKQVLTDIPELKGQNIDLGSPGSHARKTPQTATDKARSDFSAALNKR